MKIIELKSSNIKRLKAVELKLDEKKNLVLITGKNAQGKSSLIDSIWYALGGKKIAPEQPIREGADEAEISIDVSGYMVHRKFTENGSYLKVTNKDGSNYSNPQEFLDYITGRLSFDPLLFSRLDAIKQVEQLREIVGLDFSKLDEKKKKLIEDRLLVGRELKALPKLSDDIILADVEKTSNQKESLVSELSNQLTIETNKRNDFTGAKHEIENNNNAIKILEEKIKEYKTRNEELSKVEDTKVDLDELFKKISNAEEFNTKIRKAKEIINNKNKADSKDKEYKDLTDKIKAVEKEKATQLSEAKMPIEGLSFDEDTVLYKGIPYDQISSAEQLRVSMAIAMASNPKLKVILIKDGSLLDQENLKVIEGMAKDKDFQVWIEAVSNDSKVGIYIEDGTIKSIDGKEVKEINP